MCAEYVVHMRVCSAVVVRISEEGGGALGSNPRVRTTDQPSSRDSFGARRGGAARAVAWLRLALRVVAAGEGEAC